MGTCGAFDRKNPIAKFLNLGSRVTSRASFQVLEVTPLPYTPRHFMVPVLQENWLQSTRADLKQLTLGFEPPWLSVFCMIAL